MEIYSSNPPGVTEILSAKFAFIAGAGGLGSNLAMMLARAGVGTLRICDFDVIAESNLNRQAYFIDQIGRVKVDALKENLLRINPNCKLETFNERLTYANFAKFILSDLDIIFECFDDAVSKAEIFSYCVSERISTPLVTVSGLAGMTPVDEIKTSKIFPNVWLVGDGKNEMSPESGTISSRVMTAAAMQAHIGIRIMLGFEK